MRNVESILVMFLLLVSAGCGSGPDASSGSGNPKFDENSARTEAAALRNLKVLRSVEARYEQDHKAPPASLETLFKEYYIPDWYLGPLDGNTERWSSTRGDDYNYKLTSFQEDGKWYWYALAQPCRPNPDRNYYFVFPSACTYKPAWDRPFASLAELENRARAYVISGERLNLENWHAVK